MTITSLFVVSVPEKRRPALCPKGRHKALWQTEWMSSGLSSGNKRLHNLGLNSCPDPSYVTLSKILNFSVLRFSICEIGKVIISSSQNCGEDRVNGTQ